MSGRRSGIRTVKFSGPSRWRAIPYPWVDFEGEHEPSPDARPRSGKDEWGAM